MCRIHKHILSTHSVLLDILTVINIHYTPYVHILHYVHIYTHSNMRRCNRLYISWTCHGCALRLYMHISVHMHSAALFRKETLYRCCFINATCCQRVNIHSHSARLLLLFHADMFYEGYIISESYSQTILFLLQILK